MQLANIVAFCILSENNNGVLDKSPDYLFEKFNRYCYTLSDDEFLYGLDANNRQKLQTWLTKWAGSSEELNKALEKLNEFIAEEQKANATVGGGDAI